MARAPIAPERLQTRVHDLWANQWLLLASGDFAAGKFNAMTIGWGSLGTMWGKPFVQVVVRPVRYTYEFMEQHDTFTVSAFPPEYRKALELLGSRSGRNTDKIADSGLTPIASTAVAAPSFDEAELVLECRKIYYDDMEPGRFLDPSIEQNYPKKDYHRIYFGELVAVLGEPKYLG